MEKAEFPQFHPEWQKKHGNAEEFRQKRNGWHV